MSTRKTKAQKAADRMIDQLCLAALGGRQIRILDIPTLYRAVEQAWASTHSLDQTRAAAQTAADALVVSA